MRKFSIFLLIILYLGLIIYKIPKAPEYKIIKYSAPDMFYVDLNKNNVAESNELVKIYGINTFYPTQNKNTLVQSKELNLNPFKVLALGFLAENYSKKILENKNVTLEFYEKEIVQQRGYHFAKIYLKQNKSKIDLAEMFLKYGFATAIKENPIYNGKTNYNKIFENVKQLDKLNYVVLDVKNESYHTFDCKYLSKLETGKVVLKTSLPTPVYPCEYCKINDIKNFPLQNFDFSKGSLKIFFSDFNKRLKPSESCEDNICKFLLYKINTAEKSIDFAIYGISHQPKILAALIDAQKRGLKIRWVTDENSKGENIYKDVKKTQKIITDYKTDNHKISKNKFGSNAKYKNSIMHNKFFIFDEKSVWSGSANISQTDLSDFNANISFFINSKLIAALYKNEFNQMYNNKFHFLKNTIENKENIDLGSNIQASVYFSPTDKITTNQLIPIINNAKHYIYISVFLITHKKFAEALFNAKKRGVEIKILTDATSASGKYSITNDLREKGLKVKVENKAGKLHTKSLVTDDKITVIGSMNITNSGENYNDENILILNNSEIAKIFKKQFMYLWQSIPNKWLYKNPPAESIYSIGSCFDSIDNDFDEKIDLQDSGCKGFLAK